MALAAGRKALDAAGLTPADIDGLLIAQTGGKQFMPLLGSYVHLNLGLRSRRDRAQYRRRQHERPRRGLYRLELRPQRLVRARPADSGGGPDRGRDGVRRRPDRPSRAELRRRRRRGRRLRREPDVRVPLLSLRDLRGKAPPRRDPHRATSARCDPSRTRISRARPGWKTSEAPTWFSTTPRSTRSPVARASSRRLLRGRRGRPA